MALVTKHANSVIPNRPGHGVRTHRAVVALAPTAASGGDARAGDDRSPSASSPIAAACRASDEAPGKQVASSSSRRGDRSSRDGGEQRELRRRGTAGPADPDRSPADPPVAGG